MIVQNTGQVGIVFAGERSELILSASRELKRLGYSLPESSLADEIFFKALNDWRETLGLQELEFVDPLSLRLLGIEVGGDELVLLASCAEAIPDASERYGFCRAAVKGAKEMSVSLTKYLMSKGSEPIKPSADSMRCAVIAALITR